MTNSNESGLRQMSPGETTVLARGVMMVHLVRLVVRGSMVPQLRCSCGEVFPVSGEEACSHVREAIAQAAYDLRAVPSEAWDGLGSLSIDAPAGDYVLGPDWRAVPLWALKDVLQIVRVNRGDAIGLVSLLLGIIRGQATVVPDFSEVDDHAELEATAIQIIWDLLALLKADSYPVAVGKKVIDRAEAFAMDGELAGER